jgi:hypothetical protein
MIRGSRSVRSLEPGRMAVSVAIKLSRGLCDSRRSLTFVRLRKPRLFAAAKQARGGQAHDTSHAARHMALVRKASLQRDLAEFELPARKQARRVLHALLDDVLMDRYTEALPEKRLEMRGTDTRDPSELTEREIRRQMLLHVVDDGS